MPPPEPSRPVQALLLGALHGPVELIPVSSSGHLTLIPWLLGWDRLVGDPQLGKCFEVALHAGTAAALGLALRDEVIDTIRAMTPRRAAAIAVATLPAAIAGFTLESPIERRLGTPATIAAGLITGSVAMLWADRAPQARRCADAGLADALWLGIAQACALVPGVSRHGATLVAARRRRFERAAADRLSRHAALPVIGGAALLKTLRLARRGLPAGAAAPFALGTAAAFGSTLASAAAVRRMRRDRPLAPYAVYRLALAGVVLSRVMRAPGPERVVRLIGDNGPVADAQPTTASAGS